VLVAAVDLKYITEEEFKNLYEQTKKIKKLINDFTAYLKGNRTK